jgi:hypothetical protein
MLQINQTYLRILQVLALGLSLVLVYQVLFLNRNKTQNIDSNAKILAPTTDKENVGEQNKSVKDAVKVLQEFSSFETEEVMPIGRNLFEHSENVQRSFPQPLSRDTISLADRQNADSTLPYLTELIPNKIYVQNKPSKILIKGNNLNENIKFYASSILLETKFISSSEIEVLFPASLLSTVGNLQIEAKTQKTNIAFSQLTLTISKPPIPSFVFIGMFSDSGGQNAKFLLKVGSEELTLKVGDLIKNRWEIARFSGETLTIEDRETGDSYQLNKGGSLNSDPPSKIQQSQEVVQNKANTVNNASENVINTSLDTNLFKRSDKPMTSKELWEKRKTSNGNKKQ